MREGSRFPLIQGKCAQGILAVVPGGCSASPTLSWSLPPQVRAILSVVTRAAMAPTPTSA